MDSCRVSPFQGVERAAPQMPGGEETVGWEEAGVAACPQVTKWSLPWGQKALSTAMLPDCSRAGFFLAAFLSPHFKQTYSMLTAYFQVTWIYKYSTGYAIPKACVCEACTAEYRPDISCRASKTKAEFNPYYVQCLMQKSDNRALLGKF